MGSLKAVWRCFDDCGVINGCNGYIFVAVVPNGTTWGDWNPKNYFCQISSCPDDYMTLSLVNAEKGVKMMFSLIFGPRNPFLGVFKGGILANFGQFWALGR